MKKETQFHLVQVLLKPKYLLLMVVLHQRQEVLIFMLN